MAKKRVQRRLAAILSADVVGYSRLVREDEQDTLAAVKSAISDVFEPSVTSHMGRIFKTMGDAVLAEFASVVDALQCAVGIQKALSGHSIVFRIGINVGDVVVEGDDIHGDGVNIAARLEGLAKPGGICISGKVHEEVKDKVKLGFEDLGPQKVKNIAEPVVAYRVLLDPADVGKLIPAKRAIIPTKRTAAGMAAVLLVLLAAGLAFWQPWAPVVEPASVKRMAYPLPADPSVAVLPFVNNSDDPKLNFFASGLTDNLTTALAKAPGLFVIAGNSVATYKGKSVSAKQVAEELGIQYLLKGSVQKAGQKLRITTQLIDALSGSHVWTHRFDRKALDVFELQDEITLRVFSELRVNLTDGDHARITSRATENLDAMLLFVEGYGELFKWNREAHNRALKLFQAAYDADPKYARALAGISIIHWYAARRGWSASRDASIRLGKDFAESAIETDPSDPVGYTALGNIFFMLNRPKRGIELSQKAIKLAPNDFTSVATLAMRLKEFGQEKRAVELFRHAMRLSPKHPFWVPAGYGLALHLIDEKAQAVEVYKKAVALGPKFANSYARLAAVYVDLNKLNDAKNTAAQVLKLNPKFSVTKYQKSYPLSDPKRAEWYKGLLLRAGLPE
jgi:adenylate cyclase